MPLKDLANHARWRVAGHIRPLPEAWVAPLAGLRGLEVGGPSARFDRGGVWPIYPRLESCDGVQWRAETVWHQLEEDSPYGPADDPLGRLLLVEQGQLEGLPDSSWDVLMTSHVIEHFANPLAELEAWRRVLVPEGWVALVAPHREGTFDHRRPVTPLEHIVADFEAGVGEDDATHVEEMLRLHDGSRDGIAEGAERAEWEASLRDNVNTRMVHHHVFDGAAVVRLLDRAGIQVHHVAVRLPHDTFVLGRFVPEGARPDNAAALSPTAPWRRRSPFPGDRSAG